MPSNKIPLTHEFGRALAENFHHFERLQELLGATIGEWRGCGSYLMSPDSTDYEPSMYGKQCNLFDGAKSATSALEIGVHGGHSLLIMLLANPTLRITCIDICVWSHTEKCVEYLNGAFGGRVTLIKGDTLDVLPGLVWTTIETSSFWDLAHIDGCHDIAVIRREFELVKDRLAAGALVVFDDYSAPGLADAIGGEWSDQLAVVDIPNCAWTNCVTKYKGM